MRLKSVFISQSKNLRDFELTFDGTSLLDVFVGKNGSGKSNFFEALIEIFRHLVEFGGPDNAISFDYRIVYEIEGQDVSLESRSGRLKVNGRARSNLGNATLPDNLLIYYSGHNSTVGDLIAHYTNEFRKRIRRAGPGGYVAERINNGLSLYTLTTDAVAKGAIGLLSAGEWPCWPEIVEAVPEFDQTHVVFDAVHRREWFRRWDMSLQRHRVQAEYGVFG